MQQRFTGIQVIWASPVILESKDTLAVNSNSVYADIIMTVAGVAVVTGPQSQNHLPNGSV